MTSSTFAERLAYARWLRVVVETDQDFARRLGLSKAWVTKWKDRPDAPPGRREAERLTAALEVAEGWLMNGAGDPPQPESWPGFLAKFRAAHRPASPKVHAGELAREYLARREATKKAAKKAAKRGKRAS